MKNVFDSRMYLMFNVAISNYFKWIESGFRHIVDELEYGELYIVNNGGNEPNSYSCRFDINCDVVY